MASCEVSQFFDRYYVMIYRDIYFDKGIVTNMNGSEIVKYTGHVYTNARTMPSFLSKFDRSKDLYVICSSCARKKYKAFVKATN